MKSLVTITSFQTMMTLPVRQSYLQLTRRCLSTTTSIVLTRTKHSVINNVAKATSVMASSLSAQSTSSASTESRAFFLTSTVAAVTAATAAAITLPNTNKSSECSASRSNNQIGAEPVMLAPQTEPSTGILFPRLCNGMTLVGCGVRVKWGFVKVSFSFGGKNKCLETIFVCLMNSIGLGIDFGF